MDNLTHTLTGALLARAGVGGGERGAVAALVLGANLPDIDLAWSLASDLAYYHYHRGFTHSLVGGVLGAVGLWIALLAWHRLPPRSLWSVRLLAAAGAGVGSHVLMDGANAYGLRLLLPWSERWFYGDLWTIVDPWLWLGLGAALFASGPGGRLQSAAWASAAVGAGAVVLLFPAVPTGAKIAWSSCLGVVLLVASLPRARRAPPARLARSALVAVAIYAVACGAGREWVRARVAADPPAQGHASVLPRYADPLRWDVFVNAPGVLHVGTLGVTAALDPPEGRLRGVATHLDTPAAAAVLSGCAGAVLRAFFRFPVATLLDNEIVVRDLRFGASAPREFAVVRLRLGSDGMPSLGPGECP